MLKRTEIRELRNMIGWTQAELAEKAQIGLSTVISYEKGGKVRPSTEKAIRAALKKGIDMAAVLII